MTMIVDRLVSQSTPPKCKFNIKILVVADPIHPGTWGLASWCDAATKGAEVLPEVGFGIVWLV